MKITPQDMSMTIGICAVTAGVWLQFGPGWACIAGGAQLISLTLASLTLR